MLQGSLPGQGLMRRSVSNNMLTDADFDEEPDFSAERSALRQAQDDPQEPGARRDENQQQQHQHQQQHQRRSRPVQISRQSRPRHRSESLPQTAEEADDDQWDSPLAAGAQGQTTNSTAAPPSQAHLQPHFTDAVDVAPVNANTSGEADARGTHGDGHINGAASMPMTKRR